KSVVHPLDRRPCLQPKHRQAKISHCVRSFCPCARIPRLTWATFPRPTSIDTSSEPKRSEQQCFCPGKHELLDPGTATTTKLSRQPLTCSLCTSSPTYYYS